MLQNLPDKVVQTLAVELKRAESVEDIYSIISPYTYDHKFGSPRGQTSPMLYLTETQAEGDGGVAASNNNTNNSGGQILISNVDNRQDDRNTSPATTNANNQDSASQELYAASKGKDKGKVCWN